MYTKDLLAELREYLRVSEALQGALVYTPNEYGALDSKETKARNLQILKEYALIKNVLWNSSDETG